MGRERTGRDGKGWEGAGSGRRRGRPRTLSTTGPGRAMEENLAAEEEAPRPRTRTTPRVNVLDLPCPTCGETLRHRVLHVKEGAARSEARGNSRSPLEGIARCAICHTSHPFVLQPKTLCPVSVIVSEGPESVRTDVDLPEDRLLELDGTLRVNGRPVRISRIEGPMARNLPRARPSQVVALWTVPTDELHLPLSVVEGSRTRPLHIMARGDQEIRVGDVLHLEAEGESVEITGVRGRGRTFQDLGDALPAREVQRIYARSARRPPGGRRD